MLTVGGRADNGRDLAQLALQGSPVPKMHPDDWPSAITDALANLMHFARREGLDFEQALEQARRHHAAEARLAWDEVPQ